ncbi:MAG: hypothetical protein O2858_07290 [Proteobacteria bacterium]|nr:hypothetical protein [Pseudomonadota bacterium]
MSEAKRHFKLTLKVRYRAESKVKHTLERPGIWPFNKKKREGSTTTLLECDDCVIRVAEANLDEAIKMVSEDPSLKHIVGFYSEGLGDYGYFPEDWDDTEWLNTCGMEGDFIHDNYEGFSEEYVSCATQEDREEHTELRASFDEDLVEPPRRILGYRDALDEGEIEPPWKVIYSAPWGGWASGAFYPAFPTILIDDVELVEIKTIIEGAASNSSNQSEAVISLEEFKSLRRRSQQ